MIVLLLILGELKFKQKGREEQCEPDDKERAAIVGKLLGVDPTMMMKAFCKPKIKAGDNLKTLKFKKRY